MSEIFTQYEIPIPAPSTGALTPSGNNTIVSQGNLESPVYSDTSGYSLSPSGDAFFRDLVATGKITVTAGGVLGGFDIGTDYLRDTGNTFGLTSTVTAGDDIRFWAGDTLANIATAPLRIYESGLVHASLINITGGTLDVGGADATSLHFDANGNLWLGAATYNLTTNPFAVSNAGVLRAVSGTIGGWNLGATKLSSTNIDIDSTNEWIKSANYTTGVSGFKISANLVEAENIIARGVLRGTTFAYDIVSAVGGQLLVANADSLASDMTAADNSTLTIKGDTDFSVNDIIILRAVVTTGIDCEYMRVTNIASKPTYTVTRDLAGVYGANANPTWKAGTPVVVQGSSDGSTTFSGGWLKLIGAGTDSPYYSVFARTGVAYNAFTEQCRLGNLNGFLNFTTDTWGIGMGNSTSYLYWDGTKLMSSWFETITSATNLVTSDNATASTTSLSVVKLKEIQFNDSPGIIKVSFGMSANGQYGCNAYLYVNGTQIGSGHNNGTSAATDTVDITVATGDLIQLYVSVNTEWGATIAYVGNFRLYYGKQVKPETNTVNL